LPSSSLSSNSVRARILDAYEGSRTHLPSVADVVARPNRSRLASLSRPDSGRRVLNLADAVVEAGEEAWKLVAPALEGDPGSLRRLRELTREGLARVRSSGRRNGGGPSRKADEGALPDARCEGTSEERRFLLVLVRYVRETSGHEGALSGDLQVRISRRMTRALGSFRYQGSSRRITLAARLFRPGLEDLLFDTVKHELAHLADQATREDGRTCHGPSWRAWARRLGARPERLCRSAEVNRAGVRWRRGRARALRYPPEVAEWLRGE